MHLDWQIKHYRDLTLNEFHDIIALRTEVFVVEQNCAYQDLDGKDKKCYHLICRNGMGKIDLNPQFIFKDGRLGRLESLGRLGNVRSQARTLCWR